jgi:predicted methyltransferase
MPRLEHSRLCRTPNNRLQRAKFVACADFDEKPHAKADRDLLGVSLFRRDVASQEEFPMAILQNCLFALIVLLPGWVPLASAADSNDTLAQVVASRSAEDKARDADRHPVETLSFFEVAPGMTVAEGLPGGGWYTRILANYLGANGTLYGVNYADRLWPLLDVATPEWVAARVAATNEFPAQVATYTTNGIKARGFTFESVPADVKGTADRVLLIRALHNLHRFEKEHATLSRALASVRDMLKDGGLVGVEQHRAPESATDAWADGSHGYLKQSAVIALFEKAGFELVATSEINANPKDKPAGSDSVWRLPPALRGSENDPARREAMLAIGESDRMTLLFRKAGQAAPATPAG